MRSDHWFDTLNKALVRNSPRRAVLQGALAAVAGFGFGDLLTEAARNKNKNKKKKGKGTKNKKGKPKRNPALSCSRGTCAREWPGDDDEIDYCEFICEQCDGADPRDFCILKPSGGAKVAWCCEADAPCCGNWCCSDVCCDPGVGRRPVCIDDAEQACCPDDFAVGVCDLATSVCCPGRGCVAGAECPDDDCDEPCADGSLCCRRVCVDTQTDIENCGGCGNQCRGFRSGCCNGDCVNLHADENHCGGCNQPCTGAGLRCCDGECVALLSDPDHCGGCNSSCGGPAVLCCDGDCFNSRHDVSHCGACGNECEPGKHCIDGECGCPPDQVHWACPGADRTCILDASYLCCDGFSCSVGENDPGAYVCCGHTGVQGHCVRSSQGACPDPRFEPYAPHATRTFGES